MSAASNPSNIIEIEMPVMKVGVKGSDVYDSTGSALLDLSVMLVRGLSEEKINAGVESVLKQPNTLEDLCVLMFQTRNIRGGKGERTLAYEMMKALAKKQYKLSIATPLEFDEWRAMLDKAGVKNIVYEFEQWSKPEIFWKIRKDRDVKHWFFTMTIPEKLTTLKRIFARYGLNGVITVMKNERVFYRTVLQRKLGYALFKGEK